MELEGKVAVVTGGASGIGLATARSLGTAGMCVVIADWDEEALADVLPKLRADGIEAVGVPTDVSVAASVEALRDTTLEAFGEVHLVHNNAGVGMGGPIWEASEADWQWLLGVNLWGVVHGIRAFVPTFLEQDEGYVVNTASYAGMLTPPGIGVYNASKHAVVAITESLAHDLAEAGSNVKCSVVCPGLTNTNLPYSDRTRPGGPAEGPVREALKVAAAAGLDASVVGDAVLDGVRNDRFWVFSHTELVPHFDAWSKSVLAGTNPPKPPVL